MTRTELESQIKELPHECGVYQFYDQKNRLLYVGKAKNLNKRVKSYFKTKHDHRKTQMMVSRIHRLETTVVETELDALLLENNLIKQYQPRYNVMLKDDKTYPWLCIKKERFPRVFYTRKKIKDGSEYFGPYPNFKTVRTLMDLTKALYPLRTCHYDLSEEKIFQKKYKVCLEYHIGNCKGPCEAKFEENEYDQNIQQVRKIFNGNFKDSLSGFKIQMKQYADQKKFERAQEIKEKMESLEDYQKKSMIVHPTIHNLDVYSILSDPSYAYVNYLQVNHGAIVRCHTMEIKKKLDEDNATLLTLTVIELRQRFDRQSNHIIASHPFVLDEKTIIKVPQKGDKKKLIELSLRNAKYFRIERFKQIKITDPSRHIDRLMQQMKKDLRLKVEPRHIECFDNSNIQGTHPVSACVVFRNGKPSKKEYRHYNIKTVIGPDDFASMEEVILRRYKRLVEENASLPALIIVDGGKGQLSSCLKSLEVLGLKDKITAIGIAKKLEEIFLQNDSQPLYIDKRSETLQVIQMARDEAHRFSLNHHRSKRSKSSLSSKLDFIPGVGEKTKTKLLRKFKSFKRVEEASLDELQNILGQHRGQKIFEEIQKLSDKTPTEDL